MDKPNQSGGQGGGQRGGRGPQRGRGPRPERPRSEFDQTPVAIRRVTRVVRGGRRFSFSIALAVGNRRGKIGLGIGKAADIGAAMDKAASNAKKNMLTLKPNKFSSIPHEVLVKYSSARLLLKPARVGGLVAGSAARIILNLAGIKNIKAKVLSKSKNKLNIARATMAALAHFAA